MKLSATILNIFSERFRAVSHLEAKFISTLPDFSPDKNAQERGNPGKVLSLQRTFEGSNNNILYLCNTFYFIKHFCKCY